MSKRLAFSKRRKPHTEVAVLTLNGREFQSQGAPTGNNYQKAAWTYINCTIKGYSSEIIVTRVAAPCVLDVWMELSQSKN